MPGGAASPQPMSLLNAGTGRGAAGSTWTLVVGGLVSTAARTFLFSANSRCGYESTETPNSGKRQPETVTGGDAG